uniref:Major facilitator superfamily (MFS) profile domain-containing protein n=1 Tax=Hucho hucho TaxID=62062 RepID=A0A4W5JCR5_9TELE
YLSPCLSLCSSLISVPLSLSVFIPNLCPPVPQVLGLEFLLGNDYYWPLLLGLSGAPAVLQSLLLPLCPESPRYLYIKRGMVEEAKKSLRRLKGEYDPSADLEEMRREKEEVEKEAQVSIAVLVRSISSLLNIWSIAV